MSNEVLINHLSEPLNGLTTARVELHAGDGNLTVDPLEAGEQVLANGKLEYTQKMGAPIRSLDVSGGEACLVLQGNQDVRPRFRMPWSACNAATNWLVHLNRQVVTNLTARSNGGNLKLDLRGMRLTRLSTDTGGGNIEIDLPGEAAYLSVNAKTGAGNVVVSLPDGAAARIHASTGLGKLVIAPRFSQIDKTTYQSPDYDRASRKVDITATSGAGNVIVSTT